MAVYERNYRPPSDARSPEWSRFLIIPRYAYGQVFASKAFIAFLVLCAIYPLLIAVAMYLPHNLKFLQAFQIDPEDIAQQVNTFMFPAQFMWTQGFLAFLLAMFVGPALISADLRNNGMPLYLSRPFTRAEYVLGKMSVLVLLMSAITWVPGLLLYLLQSYLLGTTWMLDNLRIPVGIFLGSWIWILTLSLMSLAVSAYVKWKPIARIVLLGLYVVPIPVAPLLEEIFRTKAAYALSVFYMVHEAWAGMFGTSKWFNVPALGAWIALIGACGLALLMLARKIKPFEVVK